LAQAAVDAGAEFVTGSVSSLALVDGTCKGVHLSDGSTIAASHTIVATGAWTPTFLAQSAPKDKKLQVGDRMIAAGAIQCMVTYPEAEAHKLTNAPVIFNAMKHTEGTFLTCCQGVLR
jgi:sarcosine oxidase/L-pipecolate oxidase